MIFRLGRVNRHAIMTDKTEIPPELLSKMRMYHINLPRRAETMMLSDYTCTQATRTVHTKAIKKSKRNGPSAVSRFLRWTAGYIMCRILKA
jgi:hypothetical protein